MTKTQKFTRLVTVSLFSILLISCSSLKEQKVSSRNLDELIAKYDPEKEHEYYNAGKSYYIGDSLNLFFGRLDPNTLIIDTNFRKQVLHLLGKKYLYLASRNDRTKFYIANASNWGGQSRYMQFALNVFAKIPADAGSSYEKYTDKVKDEIPVGSIVDEMKSYHPGNEQKKVYEKCEKVINNQ